MPLTGTFQTPHAAKYLGQLCKHFAHKIEVHYTETDGTAQFVFGTGSFSASPSELKIVFDLKDVAATEAAKSVIDSHLQRFAFREKFEAMDWSDG